MDHVRDENGSIATRPLLKFGTQGAERLDISDRLDQLERALKDKDTEL